MNLRGDISEVRVWLDKLSALLSRPDLPSDFVEPFRNEAVELLNSPEKVVLVEPTIQTADATECMVVFKPSERLRRLVAALAAYK